MRIKEVACAGTVFLSASLVIADNCYFLQAGSGCGSGAGFCTEGAIICEQGYGSADTGCGRKGPLSGNRRRACYKITGVVTAPCNSDDPAPGVTVGCATEAGVCCFAGQRMLDHYIDGDLQTPSGAQCGCGGGPTEF